MPLGLCREPALRSRHDLTSFPFATKSSSAVLRPLLPFQKPSSAAGRTMDSGVGYKRKLLVDLLVVLFGISSWIAINGLWVQTPLLVDRLPESWDLPFYIVIITQMANVGPILYSILKRYRIPRLEMMAIHLIMLAGTSACLVLALFWHVTAYVGDSEHAVVFLFATGILSVVDCTSSVLFFPFITNYKSQYLSSLLIGEGLSGVVPSFAALVQGELAGPADLIAGSNVFIPGVGGSPSCRNETDATGKMHLKPVLKDPRFSVSTFFYFLFFLMLLSWLSYYLLTRLRIARSESSQLRSVMDDVDSEESSGSLADMHLPNRSQIITLLLIQGYGCFLMNGFLSALSTYSTLPYGNATYHLATTLTVISGPTATLLVFLLHHKGSFERPILPLVLVGSVAAGYLIFLATQSPAPPLQDSAVGCAVAVVTSITCHACFSYIKACIAGSLRECSLGGRKGLFYYGVATQTGSLAGALAIFCLMKFANIFHSFQPCQ